MKKPLKQLLRQHFHEQLLSKDEMAAIKPNKKLLAIRTRYWQILSLAVAAALLIIYLSAGNQPLDVRISQEIVKNHLKDMPMEILSSNLEDIVQGLNRLSFRMTQTEATEQMSLKGGRYCSIQGKLAGQLRFENKVGNLVTVYQVPIPVKWRAAKEGFIGEDFINGVAVKLFKEKGLLVGIALNPEIK